MDREAAMDTTRAAKAVRELLRALGEDPDRPELKETPARVAEFWAERLAGRDFDPAAELATLPGELAACPVILENIPFVSTCEHHLAPFAGHATVGYLPGEGGTVGLSKLVRLVQACAQRLQVQERLSNHLRPVGWGVKLVAEHTCMAHRGVKSAGVPVSTQLLGGAWSANPPEVFR
jgi:GTP cyclohydrolase I